MFDLFLYLTYLTLIAFVIIQIIKTIIAAIRPSFNKILGRPKKHFFMLGSFAKTVIICHIFFSINYVMLTPHLLVDLGN